MPVHIPTNTVIEYQNQDTSYLLLFLSLLFSQDTTEYCLNRNQDMVVQENTWCVSYYEFEEPVVSDIVYQSEAIKIFCDPLLMESSQSLNIGQIPTFRSPSEVFFHFIYSFFIFTKFNQVKLTHKK